MNVVKPSLFVTQCIAPARGPLKEPADYFPAIFPVKAENGALWGAA